MNNRKHAPSAANGHVNGQSKSQDPTITLSQQYGGSHVGSWVSRLPSSWVPYIQLARLSPPAGLFLIYFPHFFGLLLAAIHLQTPLIPFLRSSLALLAGSLFFSNAAHAWNDVIDAPIDKSVARTRKRPIPRGAISPFAAFVFTITQAAGAALILFAFLPHGSVYYALPNVLTTTYYPWAKRHTNFAQLVLGFCLAWGVVIGSITLGNEPFMYGPFALNQYAGGVLNVDTSATSLLLACILWTAIYDTIYAHQDVKDDTKLGLKSMAVLFRERTKPVLWGLLFCMLGCLVVVGVNSKMGLPYFVISLAGCGMSLGAMIRNVELKDSASCWWWFRYGFWLAGSSMAGGLLSEYIMRLIY
ncbi:UbiA prenyltransferase family-domain-containing protein [Diplogelasinospora grovesii]|uniref:4-hydroxybenzoate polyprenyltransferase, mitochondrial n=1 Tax=Diplogelasinospora grovesii TaxID=303347 RepID=A0AAN6RZB0_9PEZI|nr:UbiA prenyltransferase family-domain-containing protein [Diplogelasinospora grovesii]